MTLIVKAEMLIRRPQAEVFNAFVDPAVTTHFWFTRSSGRLEPGRRVRWDWEMYGVHDEVAVKAVEPHARILYDWSFPDFTTVAWTFTPRGADATMVSVVNSGFKGDDAAVVAQALDATQGFNIVLCAAKAWLEHGIELNAVADKSPEHNVGGWVRRR
jgi:uncharacterized protein YndB with AHSA1/START domain